jgi:hypothetical protein
LDVYVFGLSEPIGVTAKHRFWSEDRQTFVAAEELEQGERIRTANGGSNEIIRLSPRGGLERVYNLEVHGEHVYHVSALGILVHNTYWPRTAAEMDSLLGMRGERIPDLPTTPGRSKVVWRPSNGIKITFEQHPYHPGAPDWHRGPHWHLDTPWWHHVRFLPGELIPGF